MPLLKDFKNKEKPVAGNNKNKVVTSWFECRAEFSQIQMLYNTCAKKFFAVQENDK